MKPKLNPKHMEREWSENTLTIHLEGIHGYKRPAKVTTLEELKVIHESHHIKGINAF